GDLVWDSGVIEQPQGSLVYTGPQARGHRYEWRIRLLSADGGASGWSERGSWEVDVIGPAAWSAQWIARPVAASLRNARSLVWDHVAWCEPGVPLGQTFTCAGTVIAVSADITSSIGEDAEGVLSIENSAGAIVGERRLSTVSRPWDRLEIFIEPSTPLPPGTYVVRLHVDRGRLGWRTSSASNAISGSTADDGVSPLPIDGSAMSGGYVVPGTRCLGVETVPPPNPVFRTTFPLGSPVRTAVLHAVGLGYGRFLLNGQPVSEGVLDPAPTSYDRTVQFRSYDVGRLLIPGRNDIRAELGRAFWAARGANVWSWNLAPWHREPTFIAQLDIEYEDGRRSSIVSDHTWDAAAGPVISDLIYTGVSHDATRGESWTPAAVVTPPGGTLVPATIPEIRRLAEVPPIDTIMRSAGHTIYDFGTILAGRVALALHAERGTDVVVRYGEYLSEAGEVFCDNILATGNAQVDRYRASGGPDGERWEPEFSYKGFRYVSVTVHGAGTIDDIVAVPLSTDVSAAGTFSCGNDVLSWIDAATARTFRYNLHGIPTDTPVYEKNGWTADAHLGTDAVLHHFDLRTALGKWLDDHADAQQPDGTVPQIVPSPGWGAGMDPAWSASTVLIPWALYYEYGELDILRRHAPMMARYTDRVLAVVEQSGWMWTEYSWGDWLAPSFDFAPEGPAPTATMMVKHLADRMALVCRALGRAEAALRYESAARRVATAYHQAYWDQDLGYYTAPGSGFRQTMQVLPLAFAVAPPEAARRSFHALVHDLEQRTAGHLDCGAFGAKWLLPVLSDGGRDDLAVTVAVQPTRPGWAVWRDSGDTLWESWDANARSHGHYFLGAAAAWIQQRVGGLVSTAPGWSTFDVRPIVDDRILWASISHQTPAGQITVRWERPAGEWLVQVDVPRGTAATVRLPDQQPVNLAAGTHHVAVAQQRLKVASLRS
ncbi:MAG: family 78 glycoside hydrolase catalytic domain, partial [Jiangellaceae bacterium]